MSLVPALTQIISGDADDPSRDMSNWNAIRNVVNGNLDTTNLSPTAAVTDSQLSIPNRIKQLYRQGGSDTDWNTTGTTTKNVTNPIVQCGTLTTGTQTFSSPVYYATVALTFPTAYTGKPLVFVTLSNVAATAAYGVAAGSITTTGCTITVNSPSDGYVASSVVTWLAIGT